MNVNKFESEEQELKAKKSRHLSILEFYENLQIEWIQADLRHKIYPKLKDKSYWGRVKEGKRVTIEKLADKNILPSIFSDEGMLRQFEKRVYRDVSYPTFTYRDEQHKLEQEFYDLSNYYMKGADVRVNEDDNMYVGKISREYIPFGQAIYVTIEGQERKCSIKHVTRIL